MAQNNNRPNGCASGVIRAFGAAMVFGGLGNAFSGDGMGGIIVAVIGAAMLFGGLGKKKQERRQPVMTASSRMPSSPEARMHAEKAAEAAERARQLRARQQQSAERARQRQSAQQPRQTAQSCPNPEPHRHYELPRQPVSNAAKLIENRKTLYEAGLLTREEYDAEVRKLRGR